MDSTDSDENLMLRYAAGEALCFDTLYARYRVRLLRYLVRLTGQTAVAEELYQDTWSRVIDARARYQPSARFAAWLFRIAHRLAIDWLRRHASREKAEQTQPQALFAPQDDPDADRFARRVEAALHELPPEQRSIAEMKLWHGLTFEQIAETQQIPLNTAASRYRYALEKLRGLLKPLYDELKP